MLCSHTFVTSDSHQILITQYMHKQNVPVPASYKQIMQDEVKSQDCTNNIKMTLRSKHDMKHYYKENKKR